MLLAPCLLIAFADPVGRTLVTPTYRVTITEKCPEYEVGCSRVEYRAVSQSGKRITLMGKQLMAMCRDGVTPCHPVGYRFRNHGTTYSVSEEGRLTVQQGSKTLVDEQGTWQDR